MSNEVDGAEVAARVEAIVFLARKHLADDPNLRLESNDWRVYHLRAAALPAYGIEEIVLALAKLPPKKENEGE